MKHNIDIIQQGIIAPASANALFITLNKLTASADVNAVKQAISELPAQLAKMQTAFEDAGLLLTIGLSSSYWDSLELAQKPEKLQPFQTISNAQVTMPATDADMLLHIRSARHDVNYHLALELCELLKAYLHVDEMVHGFKYMDSRDFTGFVDGTENPEGESRQAVALVNDDQHFNGGSYIHIQKYHHDLAAWKKIALKQQEDSYGRTKKDNDEYAGTDKLNSAHTKRASVKDSAANSIEILRHSLPFGNLKHSGLLFASYAASPDNFNLMLQSMCNIDEHGDADKILHITSAVTGDAFFAPNLAWFESLAKS
ncbi:MAG: Dyp-type peroxidase [Oceanospirillaceae bacterium]